MGVWCVWRGVWGHYSPGNLDVLRLQHTLHGSTSTVSNFWLSMYAFPKPGDIEFLREKVLRLTEQQVGWQMVKYVVCREYRKYVRKASSLYDGKMSMDYHRYTVRFHAFSESRYNSRLFSCPFVGTHQKNNWRTPERLKCDLFTHVFTRQRRKPLTRAFRADNEQTHIAHSIYA